MPEAVLGSGSAPFLDDELQPLELGESRQQARSRKEPLEQRQAEGTPDHGGGRDQVAGLGVEPVEPRLEGFLNRGGDRGLAEQDETAVLQLERPAFAQISNCLSNEVGVAARPLGEEPDEVLR